MEGKGVGEGRIAVGIGVAVARLEEGKRAVGNDGRVVCVADVSGRLAGGKGRV